MRPLEISLKNRILRLLSAGCGWTETARRTGVSVRTVARVSRLRPGLRRLIIPSDPPPGFHALALRRCASCGAMVYLHPCLACRLQGAASAGQHAGVRKTLKRA